MMRPLFTIGHSSLSIGAFLGILTAHRTEAVADVRSQPFSRHCPQFSRPALEAALSTAGIRYVFLGRELGARRDERGSFQHGSVSFERISEMPAFATGLTRLRDGLARYRIALLCVEKDPIDCHRGILVARHAARFAEVRHILDGGRLEAHAGLEERLLRRYGGDGADLFEPRGERLKKAYLRRGEEIVSMQKGRVRDL